MNLLEAILAFRKSRYFWIFYVFVLSVIVSALLIALPFVGCLMVFLIPITMFVLPYWLKEKRLRILAVNGIIVLLVASTITTVYDTQVISSANPVPVEALRPPVSLTEAQVIPGRGPPGAYYNFTMNVTDALGRSPSLFTVWLNLTKFVGLDAVDTPVTMLPVDPADSNLSDGKAYYANLPLGDNVYFFWFSLNYPNGTSEAWLRTPYQIGPMTASFGTLFPISFYFWFLALIVPVMFYYLILMLFWYSQRARAERQRLGMIAPAETDTGFMCTNCGADVPSDAEKCPKCGAVFEEAKGPATSVPEPEKGEPPEGPDAKP